MRLRVYTDGGARGNPGPAAIGVVIQRLEDALLDKDLISFGKKIGDSTNNIAEYAAVIEALIWIKTNLVAQGGVEAISFFLDSNLVVQQLNGIFKVKEQKLRELFMNVRLLEQEVGGEATYNYIPREQNRKADMLVNKALDEAS